VNNRQRLTARDYKGARPGQLDLRRWKEFGIGLGVGLLVALVVFISDRKHAQALAQAQAERDPAAQRDAGGAAPKGTGRARSPSDTAADSVSDAAASSGAGSYAFFNGLQHFEVVVPEKEHGTRVDAGAKVARPGTYFLQAGSYPSKANADRVCQLLARQDVVANVQRVQVDANVWYRVRIGPIKDLAQLNATRDKLRAADLETLVITIND
jgi:cell division protein FtsN